MLGNRLLRVTFTVSILVHGLVLLPSPRFNPFTPAPKLQTIAVRYVRQKPTLRTSPKNLPAVNSLTSAPQQESFLDIDPKHIAASGRAPRPYVEPGNAASQQDGSGSSGGGKLILDHQGYKPAGFSKPALINSQALAIKKKITLPAIESAKIDNPSYISYYQIVREKIRRSAYQNYTHNETGEVYVSFIISNDGLIKDVRLAEDKTSLSAYLKNIALKSIRDASPFPNFPKELDYPQLSFNIIISFEIE